MPIFRQGDLMMEIALDYARTAHALHTTPQHALLPEGGRAPGAAREDARCPTDAEAAHLNAAAELLQRHGLSLSSCSVSRVRQGLDIDDDAVSYVIRVGAGVDIYALNEAVTPLQLVRGLSPSAQLDVVFQS
jgi:diadenosine tetraphosphatase ApaH/serine/threonine PP2A family protein phosphatase